MRKLSIIPLSTVVIPIATVILLFAAFTDLNAQQQPIPPDPPEIVRVTVDTATGLAGIEWNASPSINVIGYTTYYDTTDALGQKYFVNTLDIVDKDERYYSFTIVNPSLSYKTLSVAAIDTTDEPSEIPDGHAFMHLTTNYDSCSKSMDLAWTPYVGWGNDLVRYEIYYRVDNNPYSKLKDTHRDTISTSHRDVEANQHYCYFIKAIKANNESFSNIACRYVSHPIHPAWINAESASAAGDESVELKFVIDPAGEVAKFQLFKATGTGRPFIPDAVFNAVTDSVIHIDPVLSTTNKYQYRLYSLDVCDKPVTESNVCGNMVLSAGSVGLEAFLSWNPYEEYYAGVSEYHIYRDINKAGPLLIGGVYHPDTSYQDDLSFVSGEDIEDEICYHVLAVENDPWSRGNQGFSRSNVACVTVVPEILMANAVIPNSITGNNEIRPKLSFIPLKYIFVVYDRWGNRIFETQEHEIAWEGRINGGDFVSEGAYAYYIKLTTSNGIEVEKKGVITVFYK